MNIMLIIQINSQAETIGDLKAKNLIIDFKNATPLFELEQTTSLEISYEDMMKLKDNALRLVSSIDKTLNKLHPDLKEKLENNKSL